MNPVCVIVDVPGAINVIAAGALVKENTVDASDVPVTFVAFIVMLYSLFASRPPIVALVPVIVALGVVVAVRAVIPFKTV